MKTRRRLWFRAKEYGWGWFPTSWEGWLVTGVYALLFVLSTILFGGWLGAAVEASADVRELSFGFIEFVAAIVVLSYTLIRICTRFGEKPVWRWGKK